MNYLGDFAEDATVDFKWSSNDTDGASITRGTDGTIAVYVGNGTTQLTDGVTDTEDFDGVTGIHHCRIDLSASATYAPGSECQVVITGASIDGISVNAVLAHFSIERAGGVLALLKGANGLSAIKTETASIQSDTNDIQTRLPAALVSGRMDASIGATQTGAITAGGIAADAIGASELAADAVAEIAAGVRTELTTELGRIDVATSTRASQTSVDTIDDFLDTEVAAIKTTTDKLDQTLVNSSDGYIFTAAALQDAPTGGSLTAADVWAHGTRTLTAIDEDSTTLDLDSTIRGAMGLAAANLDTQLDALPTAAENADAVWDETLSTVLHATPGSAGYNMQIAGQILVDTTATGTPSTTQVQLSAGSAVDDFYNDQLLYIADGTGLGQVRPILDYVGATKTVTVSEAFVVTPASGDRLIIQTAHVHPTSQIADAVWTNGTRTLTALDEDTTSIDIDATVRAAVGLSAANLDTQLAAIDDAVDTEVAAIKAVTDKIDNTLENTSDGWVFTVNALQNAPTGGSAPTASQIADEVQTRTIAAVTTVNGLANNTVTAAALAADAVTEIQSGLATSAALATVDTVVDAIKVTTDKLDGMVENTSDGWIWTIAALQNSPTAGGGLTAADVWTHATRTLTALDEDSTTLDLDATIRGAVGLAAANLDTQIDTLPTASENASAVWGAAARTLTALDEDTTTIDLDASVRAAVGLASANLDTQLDALPTAVENADALLDRNMASGADSGSASVRTPRQALRILRNKWTIDSDGVQRISKEDDTTESWTQQLATDSSAQPVTGTDPSGP